MTINTESDLERYLKFCFFGLKVRTSFLRFLSPHQFTFDVFFA